MASTSTLLVAASNLANGVGLAANTATTTLCSTISSNALAAAYANLQPGTTNGNVLATNSLTVTSLGLPLFVSNANSACSSITAQMNTVFPDLTTFASILLTLDSFVLYSDKAYKSMVNFTATSFDNLGINVDSHQSAVTNGITTLFGGGATGAAQIKTNMGILAGALGNLGTLYDVTKLDKLGDPVSFIKYVVDNGYNYTPPVGYETMTTDELMINLSRTTGPVVARIAELSKVTLPEGHSVYSMADFLDLNIVFPPEAVALVPDKNFSGLSNMFVNLGGRFNSFADISTMLTSIEVPALPYLNSYTDPVSTADVDNLKAKIGSGTGESNNPTITDVLGTVAGIHVDELTAISTALTSIASRSTTTALVTSLTDLATACAGGDPATISSSFATAQTQATAFNSDSAVVALASTNTAITSIEAQLKAENDNITASGLNISAASSSGVAGVLAMANNLHDYGVDRDKLNYNQLFAGLVQQNVGGDAVLASLAEGKNISIQAQFSVPIGTKLA
jgi:hypothetical protein